MFEELALPITTTASARCAISVSAVWRLVVAKQRSLRDAVHTSPARARASSRMPVHSAVRERRLREHRDLRPVAEVGEHPIEIVGVLHEADRVGRDRQRADRFVVAGVAHVEDGEALAGPHPRFVVHLGDERAHGVHHVAAFGARGLDDFRRRAVGRQHQRRARRAPS